MDRWRGVGEDMVERILGEEGEGKKKGMLEK